MFTGRVFHGLDSLAMGILGWRSRRIRSNDCDWVSGACVKRGEENPDCGKHWGWVRAWGAAVLRPYMIASRCESGLPFIRRRRW